MSILQLTRIVAVGVMLSCVGLRSCLADASKADPALGRSMQLAARVHEDSGSSGGGDAAVFVGGRPYAFQATDLNGKPANLKQYRGRVVLLDFWATWCSPCCDEVPNVVAAYNKYHSKGFDVLAISLDNEKSDLLNYIRQHHVPYRQVFDGNGWQTPVAKLYGVEAIPHSILIGRTGVILAIDAEGTDLAPAIRNALANKVPAPQGDAGF